MIREGQKTLGRFELVRKIGEGACGVVHLARDTSLRGRLCALKVLRRNLACSPDALRRFKREGETGGLPKDLHVMSVYSAEEIEGEQVIVMEYVEGASLAEIIALLAQVRESVSEGSGDPDPVPDCVMGALRGFLTDAVGDRPGSRREGIPDVHGETGLSDRYFRRAAEVMAKVAEALGDAHAKGVIHRDVKPGNIMIDQAGRPRLVDFGLAGLLGASTITLEGEVLGTPQYMSPEQMGCQGEPRSDHRSDVYSLGVTLYELLTLRRPFDGDWDAVKAQIESGEPVHPRQYVREMPRDIGDIALRAMAKAPSERYETAHHLADDLKLFARGDQVIFPRSDLVRRAKRQYRLHRRLAQVVSAVMLLGILSGLTSLLVQWTRTRREVARQEAAVASAMRSGDRELADREFLGLFRLAPDDQRTRSLARQLTGEVSLTTSPPGATVTLQRVRGGRLVAPAYLTKPGPRTPTSAVLLKGDYVVRFRKTGYSPHESSFSVGDGGSTELSRILLKAEERYRGMVYVEGGRARIGAETPGVGDMDETPAHDVQLRAYFIDRFEVTNRDFKAFVDAGGYSNDDLWRDVGAMERQRMVDQTGRPGPSGWSDGTYPRGKARHPVAGISWHEACAYARWVGKRLPTEAEWEFAARSPEPRLYPWGAAPAPERCAISGEPEAVGTHEAGMSFVGCHDMAGNVWEWTSNWYEPYPGSAFQSPEFGATRRVARGGGYDTVVQQCRSSNRHGFSPFARLPHLGFRCVKDTPTEPPDEMEQQDQCEPPGTVIFQEDFRRALDDRKWLVQRREFGRVAVKDGALYCLVTNVQGDGIAPVAPQTQIRTQANLLRPTLTVEVEFQPIKVDGDGATLFSLGDARTRGYSFIVHPKSRSFVVRKEYGSMSRDFGRARILRDRGPYDRHVAGVSKREDCYEFFIDGELIGRDSQVSTHPADHLYLSTGLFWGQPLRRSQFVSTSLYALHRVNVVTGSLAAREPQWLYCINGATVSALNLTLGVPVRSTTLDRVCRAVALSPDGRLYVAHRDAITVLDAHTLTPLGAPLRVEGRPRCVSLDPTGSRLYVPCDPENEIWVLDTASRRWSCMASEIGAIKPNTITWSPDGRTMYLAAPETPSPWAFFVVNARDHSVRRRVRRFAQSCNAVVHLRNKLYVLLSGGEGVLILDSTTYRQIGRIRPTEALNFYCYSWAVSPDRTRLYLPDVYAWLTARRRVSSGVCIVDTTDDTYRMIPLPLELHDCALSRDGQKLYVVGNDIEARQARQDLLTKMLELGCPQLRGYPPPRVSIGGGGMPERRLVEIDTREGRISRIVAVGVDVAGLAANR